MAHLPPELLNVILRELVEIDDDEEPYGPWNITNGPSRRIQPIQKDLLAASLVCKGWVEASQALLWNDVSFETSAAVVKCLQSPACGRYSTQILYIEGGQFHLGENPYYTESISASLINTLLKALGGIHCICFNSVRHVDPAWLRLPSLQDLISLELTSFTLCDSAMSGDFDPVIPSFALENLKYTPYGWYSNHGVNGPLMQGNLRPLIHASYRRLLLKLMQSGKETLRTLTANIDVVPSLESLKDMRNVSHLWTYLLDDEFLSSTTPIDSATITLPRDHPFHLLGNLVNLTHLAVSGSWPSTMKALKKIPPGGLRYLTFYERAFDTNVLDSMYSMFDLPSTSGLKMFSFYLDDLKEEWVDLVLGGLEEMCDKRGIIFHLDMM